MKPVFLADDMKNPCLHSKIDAAVPYRLTSSSNEICDRILYRSGVFQPVLESSIVISWQDPLSGLEFNIFRNLSSNSNSLSRV